MQDLMIGITKMKIEELITNRCSFITVAEQYKQRNLIFEGLIVSHPVEQVVSKLNQHIPHGSFLITKDPDSGLKGILYKTDKALPIDQFKKLAQLLNSLGWFCSAIAVNNGDFRKFSNNALINILNAPYNLLEIDIAAKFDIQTTTPPKLLYHATPSVNIAKIQKIGLVPKSKNLLMATKDRIYFSSSLQNLKDVLIPHLSEINKVDSWSILQLDTTAIDRREIRWFLDTKYPHGYYVIQNIRPEWLQVVD